MTLALGILAILGGFSTAYLVSLYSLAVYIDPEEVESLYAGVSRTRREFLKKLAADPRAFVQIAAVYKSFVAVLTSGIMALLLTRISVAVRVEPTFLIPAGLVVVWLAYVAVIEYLPRRTSRKAVNKAMTRYLWVISLCYHVFFPVVRLYRHALRRVKSDDRVTEEEKEEIVERAIETLAEQAGIDEVIVEADEKEMIGHIFLLDQTVVREIMSPRPDITGIDKTTSFSRIQDIVRTDGHSRFPVYEESIDKIVGILYVKDLFNNMPRPGEKFVITEYLRKPYFVPESKVIGELLREFKSKKLHIAIVVDEYGGVAGLVTLEDILEEIVGEIQDEYDSEEAQLAMQPDGSLQVDAALLVEDLQNYLDTDFDQGDYDTVGGLIYDLVGSVPDEGTRIKWHSLEFVVVKREGQRVTRVQVIQRHSSPKTNRGEST